MGWNLEQKQKNNFNLYTIMGGFPDGILSGTNIRAVITIMDPIVNLIPLFVGFFHYTLLRVVYLACT